MSMFQNNAKRSSDFEGSSGGGGGNYSGDYYKGDTDAAAFSGNDLSSATQKDLTAIQVFVQEHDIHSPEPGVISVSLGGMSRRDFVERANKFAGGNTVLPELLKYLRKEPEFTEPGAGSATIRVDGCVEGSQRLSIRQRRDEGLANISMSDAVTAHVAYNILARSNGEKQADLFCGFVAQCKDGYLQFGELGVGRYKMALLRPSFLDTAARQWRIIGLEEA